MCLLVIEVYRLPFCYKRNKTDEKPRPDMEIIVFDAGDNVNICGSVWMVWAITSPRMNRVVNNTRNWLCCCCFCLMLLFCCWMCSLLIFRNDCCGFRGWWTYFLKVTESSGNNNINNEEGGKDDIAMVLLLLLLLNAYMLLLLLFDAAIKDWILNFIVAVIEKYAKKICTMVYIRS